MTTGVVATLIFLTFFNVGKAIDTLSLNGQWKLNDSSGEYHDLPVQVPGGIYTDLMVNKVIDSDIFYGYGDKLTKWVPRKNWTYFRTFEVTDKILDRNCVNIVFEGLDTVSDIYINDVKLGSSQNMFVQYIFSVKNILKIGTNSITIRFQSPIEVADNLAEEQKVSYVVPPECPPGEYQGECHVNMLRKMQSSFSWDWGPSFPSVGIWKDTYIEAYDVSVLRYVVSDTVENSDKNSYTLNIDAYLTPNCAKPDDPVRGTLTISLELFDRTIINVVEVNHKQNDYSEVLVPFSIDVSKDLIHEWWPNGHGAQNLYNLTVTFTENATNPTTTELVKRIGFRTIKLVQKKIGNGLSFYFEVNGEPIFMKGSNEIPVSVLPELGGDKDVIEKLLRTVRDTNMNMIRIWGGGIYESDYFYDLADEYGILIWQDFMFACALYPTSDTYLNNVIEEIRHQVKRLQSHPSIALFSGNNENEGALANNWYQTSGNFELYKKDYVKLYIDTIEKEYTRLTNNRGIFIGSSPTNGQESIDEGFVAENPGSSDFGDVHYYNYAEDSFNSNIFPKPRFASEYGYQSLPALETLLSANSNMSDLNINSAWLTFRQHHPNGNEELKLLINYQLELPSEDDEENFIKGFIYYSQIVQAMSIKLETENYRILRSDVINDVQANTMGALYWQLNDVWVAPTWSGIDFTGRWKMLQYYSKNFFSPTLIAGRIDNSQTTNIYAISDKLNSNIVNAEIKVYKWDSFIPIYNISIEINLIPNSSVYVKSFDTSSFLADLNCGSLTDAKSNCFFHLRLTADDVDVSPINVVLPNALRNSNLQSANVTIESVTTYGSSYEIMLKTDQIAMFVWLDTHDIKGVFSENGFHMVETTRTVYFNPDIPTTLEDIIKALTVIHLKSAKY